MQRERQLCIFSQFLARVNAYFADERIVIEMVLQYLNDRMKFPVKIDSLYFLYKYSQLEHEGRGHLCSGGVVKDDRLQKWREIGEPIILEAITACLPLLFKKIGLGSARNLRCTFFCNQNPNFLERYDYDERDRYTVSEHGDGKSEVALFVVENESA